MPLQCNAILRTSVMVIPQNISQNVHLTLGIEAATEQNIWKLFAFVKNR